MLEIPIIIEPDLISVGVYVQVIGIKETFQIVCFEEPQQF